MENPHAGGFSLFVLEGRLANVEHERVEVPCLQDKPDSRQMPSKREILQDHVLGISLSSISFFTLVRMA